MKYQAPSFTVPASGKSLISCDKGHAMLDVRGKCIRCGDQVEARQVVREREEYDRSWKPSVQFTGYEERDIPHGRQYRFTALGKR